MAECIFKITKFTRTSRVPKPKCKRIKGAVIECVGEDKCIHLKKRQDIFKRQLKQK